MTDAVKPAVSPVVLGSGHTENTMDDKGVKSEVKAKEAKETNKMKREDIDNLEEVNIDEYQLSVTVSL